MLKNTTVVPQPFNLYKVGNAFQHKFACLSSKQDAKN